VSFRLKTILGVALVEAVLLSALIVSGIYYLRASNEAQLQERADTTAQLIATMTADSVISTDLATLDILVEQALTNPAIDYVRVRGTGDVVLSEGGDPIAARCFRQIATLTRGAYCPFDLASADRLKELLAAVAVYATGGRQALLDYGAGKGESVKLLTSQVKG
jgi:hypothetical protein